MTDPAVLTAPVAGGAATRPPARRRPRSHLRLAAAAFMAPVVIFLAVFFVYPIIRGVVLSLQDFGPSSFVTGIAPFVGFDNYVTVVTDPIFASIAWHTVVFTVVSLVGQFTIGMALALFFSRRFPLSATFRSLILLPWLLPLIVSATAWRWIFDQQFGILNAAIGTPVGWLTDPSVSLWAVIIANIWLGIPFNMVLLHGGLQGIPESLYEAAALDGASRWRSFWSITWPLLRPVTSVTLLLGLVYTIKVFDVIWILTKGGPANSSHTLATWAYEQSFTDLQFGVGAAAGQILVIVALVFGVIYIRAQRKEDLG
ncbi:ABC transporter permease [Rathayibacter sp. AY1G1]|jgi:multiple sugar transport system permease protein|uniref:carbohydrate ABC transporter permease n=1 Tax=unclassified Rathayibacter TaxID=2609250 RepID=UPI000CE913B3|nr:MULTISPECIES: sugar ABC transporter permease [unclassified Rathayibacter]PPF19492.1 ABC transporter permease [Rathayibacter sp. AY1A4]PPF21317.1 ABC transporter permease [Rathayibacter sp. AY1A7]PPF28930.1 ABC transporter permease [Rathayibacter sp. AY1F2]PPF38119.1 ABC transporter permease [Rathayibacter sp. AY1A2]PPF59662.1 ABC transporter permease [Rathayibacter sp. AY1C2]